MRITTGIFRNNVTDRGRGTYHCKIYYDKHFIMVCHDVYFNCDIQLHDAATITCIITTETPHYQIVSVSTMTISRFKARHFCIGE